MKQTITIPSGDRMLAATVFIPDNKAKHPAVILGAGWKNTLENNYEFAGAVSEGVNAVVIAFDYSGIGSSTGNLDNLSIQNHLDDLLAVYDYLATLDNVDSVRIAVNGGSYSGYTSTLLTLHRNVKSLLLRVPAVYPDEMFSQKDALDGIDRSPNGYFEDVIANKKIELTLKALHEYTNPLLVQARGGDDLITSEVIDFFCKESKSNNLKRTLLEGAAHKIDGALKQKATQECIDWFLETL